MSQPRERDEDTEMAISYASRAPAGHPQTLPSFREVRQAEPSLAIMRTLTYKQQLLPPHLHDEIDSSTYYNSRPPSSERPPSGHEMAADPRSIPGYPSHPPSKAAYGEHPREYTTRTGEHHASRPMSDPMSMRGPSPILPPIRDLQSMAEAKGYPPDSRMAPRSDPFAHDYRGQPGPGSVPGAMPDRRNPEPYPPMMHQPPYGHPGMPYPGDPEQVSPSMMGHPAQANFGIVGDGVDPKMKRRRGNLPKPVTDILRAWFHEHLDHPYPSEEDKQMFMTRTGLSISQVSLTDHRLYGLQANMDSRSAIGSSMPGDDNFLRCAIKCEVAETRIPRDSRHSATSTSPPSCPLLTTRRCDPARTTCSLP